MPYPDNFNSAAFDARYATDEAQEAFDYRKQRTLEAARNAFKVLPNNPWVREAVIMTAISNTQRALREWMGDGVSDKERVAIKSALSWNREGELGSVEDALSDLFHYYRAQLEDEGVL
jgi:hypothetical protein